MQGIGFPLCGIGSTLCPALGDGARSEFKTMTMLDLKTFSLLALAVSGSAVAYLGFILTDQTVLICGVAGAACAWFFYDKEMGA
jgi:hypothetical protein